MKLEALLLLGALFSAVQATSSGELTALSDLYYACDGASWRDNSNWLVGDPCQNATFTWYGVSCESGHVVGLYLNDNDLYGTLPMSLVNLYEADTLSLYNNDIQGPIPDNWYNIRTLVKIDLHGNVLSGTIPDTLGDLLDYNLSYLDLSDNELTGAIPSFFDGAESEFSYVDLSENNFICPIPSWATYTQADCIQWTVTGIQPLCLGDGEPYLVFGNSFGGLEGVECTLYDTVSKEMLSSVPAVVLTEEVLQCLAARMFSACDGSIGNRLYEMAEVGLTYNGQLLSGNSTLPILGITNPLCSSYTDESGVTWAVPDTEKVIEACSVSQNPTPWSCPTEVQQRPSSYYVSPTFDPSCASSSNVTCLWTTATYSSQYLCPVFQCYTYQRQCYYRTACVTSSSYGPCIINQPDCDNTC